MSWALRTETKADRIDYLCREQRITFKLSENMKPVVRICAGSIAVRGGERHHFSWAGEPGHWVIISDPQIPTVAEAHDSFLAAVERYEELTGTSIR